MDNLCELVKKAYDKDDEAILAIIQIFKPFLRSLIKTSSGSFVEESDLILHVIHIIDCLNPEKLNDFKTTGQIFNYFKVGIRNKYIQLIHEYFDIYNNEISLNDNFISETSNEIDNLYESIYIEELLNHLTQLQRKVIIQKIINNKSDVEISCELNITRQSVNRIKNRALRKLKDYI